MVASDGALIVPCISRMASPLGVWRRGGRGLGVVVWVGVEERGWRGIEGMLAVLSGWRRPVRIYVCM